MIHGPGGANAGAMDEHQHAGWNWCTSPNPDSCALMCGDHHGVAIHPPTGNLWMGADFAETWLDYMNSRNSGHDLWWPTVTDPGAPFSQSFRAWENRSNDGQHPEWGGRDFVTSMAFDAYGDLWIASYFNGIARARIDPRDGRALARSQADLDYFNHRSGTRPAWPADDFVWTVAGDGDGSVWAGGPHGAWRFVAATGQWVAYGPVLPGSNVAQIAFDPRPGVRAVLLATSGGLVIYRGK